MSLRLSKTFLLSGTAFLPGGILLLSGAFISGPANARCVNTTTGVEVTQSTGQPTTGQRVVCDTTAPNPTPATTTISGAPGSTGVSVTVLPGATVASTARAIGVVNASTVLNQGTVRTTGLNAFGLSATGAGSTLTNEGTIITTGNAGHGMNAGISGQVGSNTALVNRGTISTSGPLADGVRSLETSAGTRVINSGTITATGGDSNGVSMLGGSFTNEAGGAIRGQANGVIFNGTFDNAVVNSGSISGGGAAVQLGAGNDTFVSATNSTVIGAVAGGGGTDTFTFDRSDDVIITHSTLNFEALIKNAGNRVTLGTNVTLSPGGVTTINGGTLAIAAGRVLMSSNVTSPGNGNATLENAGQITGNILFGGPGSTGTYTFNNLVGATLQGNFAFQGNGSTTFSHAGTMNGNIIGSGAGSFLFDNNGTFNGGITINGTGANTIVNRAGRNINNAVSVTRAQNTVDNAGAFNQGLALIGSTSNSVINRTGASISQTFSITGDGTNTVANAGIINNGLTLDGNGTNGVTNAAGAAINQNIVSNGAAADTVDNSGLINNSILLNAGTDIFVNRTGGEVGPATANAVIDMGAGADQFFMLGGGVNAQVLLGADNDTAEISGGVITQFVRTEDGSDQLLWTGGTIGAVDMGSDEDTATFSNLTVANLTPGLLVDGGQGSDRLIWNNTSGDGVARYEWHCLGADIDRRDQP